MSLTTTCSTTRHWSLRASSSWRPPSKQVRRSSQRNSGACNGNTAHWQPRGQTNCSDPPSVLLYVKASSVGTVRWPKHVRSVLDNSLTSMLVHSRVCTLVCSFVLSVVCCLFPCCLTGRVGKGAAARLLAMDGGQEVCMHTSTLVLVLSYTQVLPNAHTVRPWGGERVLSGGSRHFG